MLRASAPAPAPTAFQHVDTVKDNPIYSPTVCQDRSFHGYLAKPSVNGPAEGLASGVEIQTSKKSLV